MNKPDLSCDNCGSRIEQYSRFCRSCGMPVNQAAQTGGSTVPELDQKTTRMDRPEIRVPRWRLSKVEGVNIPDGFPMKAQSRIGRDPHCDIHLPSTNVSRYHAQVHWTGTGFDISDLNSTNGTYVNRRLIKEPTRLKIGSSVQIGEYTFLVMKDAAQCSNCRETVRSDDRFCQYCGNPLIDKQFHPPAEHVHEEPFPETTPVPVIPQDTNGLETPQFNAPLPADMQPPASWTGERPASVKPEKPASTLQEKPPPPPAKAAAQTTQAPAPPPKPPPPPENSRDLLSTSLATEKSERQSRGTCLLLVVAAVVSLIALGAVLYAIFKAGLL